LDDVRRRVEPVRHATRQRRVEVHVGVDVPGENQASGAVDDRPPSRQRGLDPRYPLSVDLDVRFDDADRIERADDQTARQCDGHALASLGTAARAAAESFIGNRVRQTPSNSCNAAATADAVGTSAISPTPFAPYGPSGCGSSTKMTSTGGMPAGGMMLSDLSVSVLTNPSSMTNSSDRECPRP